MKLTISESDLEGIGSNYLWYHILLKMKGQVVKSFDDYDIAKSFRTTFQMKYEAGEIGTSMKPYGEKFVVFVWNNSMKKKEEVLMECK